MKKNSFIKNVLVLLLSQIIIKGAGIIYKLYLTNKTGYGDVGNALFLSAFQIYTMCLTICSIGIPNAISSIVSAKFAVGESYGAYRILKIAIAIFGTIGFATSIFLYYFSGIIAKTYLEIPETKLIIKTLAPSIFIVAITSVFKGYFNGKQKMNITANSLSLEQIVKTILTIVFVEIAANTTKNNTLIMVYIVGITTTIGNIISLIYIIIHYIKSRQEIWTDIITSKTIKKERKRTIIKNILNVSFPIAICALIGTLNKTIDAMTVVRISKNYLGEKEAIKQYGILSGKIESLVTFPLSFNIAFTTTLIPKISEYKAKENFEKVKQVLKMTLLTSLLIAIPCFTIMFIYSTEVLSLLFPNALVGSLMLKISSITTIILALIQTINSYLQGMNKMKIQIISIGIGAIIKIILNIVLINNRFIGVYGAIISNIISFCATLIILIYHLIKKEKLKFEINKFIIKPVLAFLVMLLTIKFCKEILFVIANSINFIISSIIGLIIYMISVMLLQIISRKDVKIALFGKHNV